MKKYKLKDISRKYDEFFIDSSILMGDIADLYIFNKSKIRNEVTSFDEEYFYEFVKHFDELSVFVRNNSVTINFMSLNDYKDALMKLNDYMKCKILIEYKKSKELGFLVRGIKKAYEILDFLNIEVEENPDDLHETWRLVALHNQYDFNSLQIYMKALHAFQTNKKIAILSNNRKYLEYIKNTNKSPTIYLGSPFMLPLTFQLIK